MWQNSGNLQKGKKNECSDTMKKALGKLCITEFAQGGGAGPRVLGEDRKEVTYLSSDGVGESLFSGRTSIGERGNQRGKTLPGDKHA